MHSLRIGKRGVCLSALLTLTAVTSPAIAQDPTILLEQAIQLFAQGDYVAAQEKLAGIDRDALNDGQKVVRDAYVNRTQVAITMSEKALRDLEDAETAHSEGDKNQARGLLRTVVANAYASPSVTEAAANLLRSLNGAAGVPQRSADQPQPRGQKVNGQRARVLTAEADEMVRAVRYAEARRLYNEALSALPGYPEAVEGLKRLQQHENTVNGLGDQSLADQIRAENQINWQRAEAEYRDAERQIREHVGNERFAEANQLVTRARQIVEAGAQFADPVTKYEGLRDEADALDRWVQNEERLFHERKQQETQEQIREARAKQLRDIEERRAQQVEALMNQALQHRKDGDLVAAINVLKQVTIIDPRHRPARWMMDEWEERRQFQRAREIRNEFYRQTQKSLIDVEEAKIPWQEEIRYPRDWPELIQRATRQTGAGSASGSRLFGALDRRIPVDFRKLPFEQVIERLVDAHRLPLIVNWNDLERAGVSATVRISLSLPQQITLKTALTEILDQAGGGAVDLGFDVLTDVIKIATRETIDKNVYLATYDIADLLMEIPNFTNGPEYDLGKILSQSAARQAQRADRPWLYGDDDDDEAESDPGRARRVRKIIDLIKETIQPASWYRAGPSTASIHEINGQLVVTQNSAGQRQVGGLLGRLREQRRVQIAVEARFLTVTSNYLEELGIDIDIVLNSGSAGFDFIPGGAGTLQDPVLGNTLLLPRSLTRLGFTPATPALGNALTQTPATIPQPFGRATLVPANAGGSGASGTPIPIRNNLLAFTDPSFLNSDIAGSFAGSTLTPAFSLFGSFLDNIQVDFLIRATQADSRSTVLTAPRLVLSNGQTSFVAVGLSQGFVSSLTPVVATGAVGVAPTTQAIPTGASLVVTGTVSADRRYVTLTLRPTVTRLLALQTFPFTGGAAGGGFGGGPALAAFIQLPSVSQQQINTTVSVPDGGTLLIGGQKLASETEVEVGVPILSKIPILKRLYSSRSMVKDEQTLLILVKPRILIQAELEEQAFPSFGGG